MGRKKYLFIVGFVVLFVLFGCEKKPLMTFDEIEAMIEADDIKGAKDALEHLIKDDKENYQAWIFLADLYSYENDIDGELDVLEDMITVIQKNYQEDDEDIEYALDEYDYFIGVIMTNHDPDLDVPSSNEILMDIYEDQGIVYEPTPYDDSRLTDYVFTPFQGPALTYDADKTGQELLDSVECHLTRSSFFNIELYAVKTLYDENSPYSDEYTEETYYFYDGNLRHYQYNEFESQQASAYGIYNPYYGMNVSWNDSSNYTWIAYDEDYDSPPFKYPCVDIRALTGVTEASICVYDDMDAIHVTTASEMGNTDIYISIDYGIILKETTVSNEGTLLYEYTINKVQIIQDADMTKFEVPTHLDFN